MDATNRKAPERGGGGAYLNDLQKLYGQPKYSPTHRRREGIEGLLSRLERVKQTGPGRWIALCSAHDDRSPSLSIRETEDGRTLVHCFGGCSIEAVLDAVGLTFKDLFPPRTESHHSGRERASFNARDVLSCLATEARIAALAARQLLDGFDLEESDVSRVELAADRIESGLRLAGGAS